MGGRLHQGAARLGVPLQAFQARAFCHVGEAGGGVQHVPAAVFQLNDAVAIVFDGVGVQLLGDKIHQVCVAGFGRGVFHAFQDEAGHDRMGEEEEERLGKKLGTPEVMLQRVQMDEAQIAREHLLDMCDQLYLAVF
ncbi:hypothetical protein VF10_38025, partial [Nostoc linckia z13]